MKLVLSLYEPEQPANFEMAVTLDPEVGAEISEVLGRVQGLPAVTDDSSLALVIETAKDVKGLINGIEESREGLKKPFLSACRSIDDAARKARSRLGEVYADLMSAAAIYEGTQKKKREAEKAEQARLARAAYEETDEVKRAELIAQAEKLSNHAAKGLHHLTHYEFIIEDAAEALRFNPEVLKIEVNKLYCQDLIRSMKAAGTKQLAIPGIKIIETESASVHGK